MTREEAKKIAKKILSSLAKTEASFQVRKIIREKVKLIVDAHRDNLLLGGGVLAGAAANEIDLSRYENLGKLTWDEIPPVFREIYPQQLIAGGIPEEFAQDLAKVTAEASFNKDLTDTLVATHPEIHFTGLQQFGDEIYDIFPDILTDVVDLPNETPSTNESNINVNESPEDIEPPPEPQISEPEPGFLDWLGETISDAFNKLAS